MSSRRDTRGGRGLDRLGRAGNQLTGESHQILDVVGIEQQQTRVAIFEPASCNLGKVQELWNRFRRTAKGHERIIFIGLAVATRVCSTASCTQREHRGDHARIETECDLAELRHGQPVVIVV